jgi:hypothetical protein
VEERQGEVGKPGWISNPTSICLASYLTDRRMTYNNRKLIKQKAEQKQSRKAEQKRSRKERKHQKDKIKVAEKRMGLGSSKL